MKEMRSKCCNAYCSWVDIRREDDGVTVAKIAACGKWDCNKSQLVLLDSSRHAVERDSRMTEALALKCLAARWDWVKTDPKDKKKLVMSLDEKKGMDGKMFGKEWKDVSETKEPPRKSFMEASQPPEPDITEMDVPF